MNNVLKNLIINNYYYIIDTQDNCNYIVQLTKVKNNTIFGNFLSEDGTKFGLDKNILDLSDSDIVAFARDEQVTRLKNAKKMNSGWNL